MALQLHSEIPRLPGVCQVGFWWQRESHRVGRLTASQSMTER